MTKEHTELFNARESGKPAPDRIPSLKRSPWVTVAKLLVAAVLLFWLYRINLIDFDSIQDLTKNPWLLISLILLSWLTYPLCVLRWRMILRSQNVSLGLWEIFRVLYLSSFAGLFLPGLVGGDALRIVLGNRKSSAGIAVMAITVGVDRMLGVSGLLACGFIVSLCLVDAFPEQSQMRQLAYVIFGLFSTATVLAASLPALAPIVCRYLTKDGTPRGKIAKVVQSALERVTAKGINFSTLVAAWLLSIMIQGKDLFLLFLIAEATGFGNLGLLGNAIAGTVAFLTQILPLTPGGLGIGEAAYGQVANMLASNSPPASYGSIMLGFRILCVIAVLPAIVIFFLRPDYVSKN